MAYKYHRSKQNALGGTKLANRSASLIYQLKYATWYQRESKFLLASRYKAPPSPSEYETRQEELQELLTQINEEILQKAGEKAGIPKGVLKAFEDYEAQHNHKNYTALDEHGKVRKSTYNVPFNTYTRGHESKHVHISARGNLQTDLSFLALTNLQVLKEMWGMCFPGGPRYTMTVVNFDYFPLYRFFQMLQQKGIIGVPGECVDIILQEDDTAANYDKKFTKVKRLIEMRWLQGLPLWDCLTGLREEEDPDNPEELDHKRVFWNWMYAVRQIVALYNIEPAVWRRTSIKYIQRYEALKDDDFNVATIDYYSNAEIVQAIIDFLGEAIEYRLGWRGHFGDDSQCEDEDRYKKSHFFRFMDRGGTVAYELEHAIVLVANQYSKKVDSLLRSKLGTLYGEWEAYEDRQVIPMNLVL